MIAWIKNKLFSSKSNLVVKTGKLYILECDIVFNNTVVGKKKFSIYAGNKYAAKSAIIDAVKIVPKRAYLNKKK